MQSGQKGSLENKYVEMRYILPKDTDLKALGLTEQSALNLVMSHVDSVPVERHCGKSPLNEYACLLIELSEDDKFVAVTLAKQLKQYREKTGMKAVFLMGRLTKAQRDALIGRKHPLFPFSDFSMRYQIQDASDPILKEDEHLVIVYITKASLIDEVNRAIYSDRGFISYKDAMKFDKMFYKITYKLEILAHTKKRNDALETGREMVRIIKEIETDDYFPLYNIEAIRRIVDPYGNDEEMQRLCKDLFF